MDLLKLAIGILGLGALTFGLISLLALIVFASSRSQRSLKSSWLLGVCADYARYVGVPLWLVRGYALLYGPFLIGLGFYLLYYWIMRRRIIKDQAPSPAPRNVQITRMDTIRYP